MKSDNDTTFDWIVRIIETSTNPFHFECVDKLIELYFQKTNNDNNKKELELLRWLRYNDTQTIL
jgi:hypothetical protein